MKVGDLVEYSAYARKQKWTSNYRSEVLNRMGLVLDVFHRTGNIRVHWVGDPVHARLHRRRDLRCAKEKR
mgnify:CR=1 FL=1